MRNDVSVPEERCFMNKKNPTVLSTPWLQRTQMDIHVPLLYPA